MLSDEEKKALKDCDIIFMCLEDMMSEESANDARKSYKIIRNLIETQQKEIEELKKNYIRLQNTEAIQDIYIKKDKIKAILEEYKYTEIGDNEKIIEFYKKMQSLLEKE